MRSIGFASYNLTDKKVNYFMDFKKGNYVLGDKDDFKYEFKNYMNTRYIDTSQYLCDLNNLALKMDRPKQWLQIEGHRNVMVAARMSSDYKRLLIQVCTTARNYYNLEYSDLINIGCSYYQISEDYDGCLSASLCFSKPNGYSRTFNWPSPAKWLENQRQAFLR